MPSLVAEYSYMSKMHMHSYIQLQTYIDTYNMCIYMYNMCTCTRCTCCTRKHVNDVHDSGIVRHDIVHVVQQQIPHTTCKMYV